MIEHVTDEQDNSSLITADHQKTKYSVLQDWPITEASLKINGWSFEKHSQNY